ncbi:MAG: hypothetical protein JOY68_07555 [Candidatus Dormibacteraeota bacterium]|nr:hypothetical protein [Candidatus Dormibacteraeota bacterium]
MVMRGLAGVAVACAAASLAGAALWHTAAVHSLLATPGVLALENSEYTLFQCRELQLRAEVPRGAKVYIAAGPALEVQRAAEFMSGWALLVVDEARAEYVVEPGPSGHGCDGGVGFVVEAR